MTRDARTAAEFLFTKLRLQWRLATLGAGDRWTITSPAGARLATIGEPLLASPLRRGWQAMSPTYPASDRFHCLEFEGESEIAPFVLEKLHVTKKYSVVRRPDGTELGRLRFERSAVEAKRVCLAIRDAAGAPLGEVLRSLGSRPTGGGLGYTVHGADRGRIATVDGVPRHLDAFSGTYPLRIEVPLPEPVPTLLLAAALACPYMRV